MKPAEYYSDILILPVSASFIQKQKPISAKYYEASWKEEDNRLVFTIKADRFLRNMVRAIVGTMVEIGIGKMNSDEFEEIILARDRCRAGKSAPAKGLFLTDIEYPEEIFI